MYSKSMGFLLVLVFASATYAANGASSVRLLGTNNLSNSNTVSAAAPVRDTDSFSKTRKASLPLKKTLIASTNKEESNKTDSASGRLSVIKNLSLQNPVKYTTQSGTSGSAGSPLSEISKKAIGQTGINTGSNAGGSDVLNKIDRLEDELDKKASAADLLNYYTKQQIDDKEANYYNADEIDAKLAEIQGDIDNIIVNTSAETIENHTTQIQELQQQYNTIQGSNVTVQNEEGQQINDVSVVDTFDSEGFDWGI